jgi:hypothetical protein
MLIRFMPPPFSPFSLLRTISTGFLVLFSYRNTKYFHLIHLFLMPAPFHWWSPPDRTCFLFLSFVYLKRTFLFIYDKDTGASL